MHAVCEMSAVLRCGSLEQDQRHAARGVIEKCSSAMMSLLCTQPWAVSTSDSKRTYTLSPWLFFLILTTACAIETEMLSKMWCRSSVRGGRVQAMASSVDARESPQSGVKVVQPRQVAREETASQRTLDESKMTECVVFAQQRSLACPVSEVVGVHVHLYFCVRRGLQPRLRIHSHAALQHCLYV